jgi:DnaJ-domain-containing protein 1
VSLGRRLWNVARAELRDALKRPARREDPPAREDPAPPREPPPDARAHAGQDARPPRERARGAPSDTDLRRWYANLELPYGATADEVRAAYRRLMRRYHPDRHHGDPDAEKVAGELAQGLRRAYEGLLAHLS